MIYLFSNESYGKEFILTAKSYCSKYGNPITVVYSDKRKLPDDFMRKIYALLSLWVIHNIKEVIFRRTYGMRLLHVKDVNARSFLRQVNKHDYGIIAGFNQIFKKGAILRFRRMVNFHPSVLPLYKGPVPSYWCIVNGEEKTGYTLHVVTEKIDDGEILFQEEIPVAPISNADALDQKIATHASATLWKVLEHIRTGDPWKKVQLDASRVYRKNILYASFPDNQGT